MASKFFRPTGLKVRLLEKPPRYLINDEPFELSRGTMIDLTLVYILSGGRPNYLRSEVIAAVFGERNPTVNFNTNVIGELKQNRFERLAPYLDFTSTQQIGVRWEQGISVDLHECRMLIQKWHSQKQAIDQRDGDLLVEALSLFRQPLFSAEERKRERTGNVRYRGSFYQDSATYSAFTSWREVIDTTLKTEVRWASEQLTLYYCTRGDYGGAARTLDEWLSWDSGNLCALRHQRQVYATLGDGRAQRAAEEHYREFAHTTADIQAITSRAVSLKQPGEQDPRTFCELPLPTFSSDIAEIPGTYSNRFIPPDEKSERASVGSVARTLEAPAIRTIASATVFTNVDDIKRSWRTRTLYGRDEIIEYAMPHLRHEDPRPLILHGLPGMGKSALARRLVVRSLEARETPVMWLDVGQASAQSVMDAIGDALGIRDRLDKQNENDRIGMIKSALLQNQPKLIVLDDVWLAETYHELIDIIPVKIAIVVTTRLELPIDDQQSAVHLELRGIEDTQALELLNGLSSNKFGLGNPDVATLIERLQGHPLSIRIAAAILSTRREQSPKEITSLLNEISRNITEIDAPNLLLVSFAALMKASVDFLSEHARAVFKRFSALMASQFTTFLMDSLLMEEVGSASDVAASLDELRQSNLIEFAGEVQAEDRAIGCYTIHDHVLEYARVNFVPDEQLRLSFLRATYVLTDQYADEHDVFRWELGNVLGVLTPPEAFAEVEALRMEMTLKTMLRTQDYFYSYGYSEDGLRLLERAIIYADEQLLSKAAYDLHRAKGTMFLTRRNRPDLAIDEFNAALKYADSLCMKARLNYGIAVASIELKNGDNALAAIQRGEAFLTRANAEDCSIERAKLSEALGRYHLYITLSFEQAKEQFHKLYTTAPDLDMKFTGALDLAHALGELGDAQGSFYYYERAEELARELEDTNNLAYAHQGLGEASHQAGKSVDAQSYFVQAFEELRQTDDLEQLTRLIIIVTLELSVQYYVPFEYAELAIQWLSLSNERKTRKALKALIRKILDFYKKHGYDDDWGAFRHLTGEEED